MLILATLTFSNLLSQTTIKFFNNFNIEKYYYDIQTEEIVNNLTIKNFTIENTIINKGNNNVSNKENELLKNYFDYKKKIKFIKKAEKDIQEGTYLYFLNLINKSTSDLNYEVVKLLYENKIKNNKKVLSNYLKIQNERIQMLLPLSLKSVYKQNKSLLFKDIKELVDNLSILYYIKINKFNKDESKLFSFYNTKVYNIDNFINTFKKLLKKQYDLINKLNNRKVIILEKKIRKKTKNNNMLNKINKEIKKQNKIKNNLQRQYYLLILFYKIKKL